jgi:hypothetical protein
MAIDPTTGLEIPEVTQPTDETLLGGPETQVTPSPAPVVTPESTVSNQLSTLLSKGSPVMTLAESKAKEQAQRSGLLSSSLAVGAGQRAVIESALPIAQQDARTFAESGLLAQRGQQDIQLAQERGDISSVLQQEGATQTQETQRQAATQRLELEDVAAANAIKLEDARASNTLSLETFAQTQQNNRLATELNQQLKLAENNILAENKQVFTESTGKMFQQYQDTFTKIQTTADDILDAGEKNRLIKQNQVQLQNQIDVLASLYSIPLAWETGTAALSTQVAVESKAAEDARIKAEVDRRVAEVAARPTPTPQLNFQDRGERTK